jgi:signal transduction histidine kinase
LYGSAEDSSSMEMKASGNTRAMREGQAQSGAGKAAVDSRPAILVVDDDSRNLFAMERALEDIGVVVTADSGEEALRQLLNQDFAVILLDVIMPGMDGYDTAALIRARERTRQVPIIFLTAVNKDDAYMLKGYSMGAVDFVFKPVDTMVLRSKVSVFVELFAKNQEIQRKAAEEQRLLEENFRVRTEKLLAEQALQRSEERQAAILRSLPLALYSNGFDNRVGGAIGGPQFFSDNVFGICGFPVSRFKDDPDLWLSRIHPEERERVVKEFERLGVTESMACEYRWRCADDEYRYFLDQAVVIRDEDGRPAEIVGSLTDITERRQLEHQLVQAQKLDAIGKLTGGIAHDFNNMLTVVIGCLDRLRRSLKDDSASMRRIEMGLQGALRCSDLTRRLLMFARRQMLRAETVDLNLLVGGIADMVRRVIGDDIELVLDCEPGQLLVKVDRTQAESALLNLVVNARDAMPGGGVLTISTREVGGGAGRVVRLTVTDTGVGIPKDVLNRVFEPFFTTKEPGKGTGLGLSIIYGFVKESGGNVTLDSEVGHGTSVMLELPAQAGEIIVPQIVAPERAAVSGARSGETVLVVEDDEGVRQIAVGILEDLGYHVVEAQDGRTALDLFDRTPDIHLVFTDLVMPGMSGRDLAEELMKREMGAKVLLTSAYTDRLTAETTPSAVTGFLHKPYGESDLAQAVRRAMDGV